MASTARSSPSRRERQDGDGRNITIYAEGAVDRSPCGTGTSAKLACLYADGRVRVDQPYVHESVIGTTFTGRVLGETSVGPYPAVETEIAGRGLPDRVSAVRGRSRRSDSRRVPGSMRRQLYGWQRSRRSLLAGISGAALAAVVGSGTCGAAGDAGLLADGRLARRRS